MGSYIYHNDLQEETAISKESMQREVDIIKHMFKLRDSGHTCIDYIATYPRQLSWCGLEPCTHYNDTETNKRIAELQNKGHKCIGYVDIHPMKISWCQQEICIY